MPTKKLVLPQIMQLWVMYTKPHEPGSVIKYLGGLKILCPSLILMSILSKKILIDPPFQRKTGKHVIYLSLELNLLKRE